MLIFTYICLVLFHIGLGKRPNVVVILTDDQDLLLNGMLPLTKTHRLLSQEGVTFQNAFVNAPICCPSRSTFLSGQLPHNTGVRNNSLSGNCNGERWRNEVENGTIATALDEAGYVNFYAGKYLNQYGNKKAGGTEHVPKGWHWWYGLVGNSKYYNYHLSVNGTNKYFGFKPKDYLTDVIKNKAVEFLKQDYVRDRPFFMVLATPAAHAPWTPALRHVRAFPDMKALRTPSFNYTPINKHWLLRMEPIHLPSEVSVLDDVHRNRQKTLLAVDDLVEEVVQTLKDVNELDNTYVILTSDNGFHIGQFGQPWDKRQPYDTDIRVPLIVRGPGLKKKFLSVLPVQTIDLGPTILRMAGVGTPEHMDGKSVLDEVLSAQDVGLDSEFAKNILIEYSGEGDLGTNDKRCQFGDDFAECWSNTWCKCEDTRNNTYSCVRRLSMTDDLLFCKFDDDENFHEAYDLNYDMYELNNIYDKLTVAEITQYSNLLEEFSKCKGASCRGL